MTYAENVFIVGQSDDELNNKFTPASDNCATISPVGMFPVDPRILLMKAYHVGSLPSSATVINQDAIEVLSAVLVYIAKI